MEWRLAAGHQGKFRPEAINGLPLLEKFPAAIS
jgi:hypothetical protein